MAVTSLNDLGNLSFGIVLVEADFVVTSVYIALRCDESHLGAACMKRLLHIVASRKPLILLQPASVSDPRV